MIKDRYNRGENVEIVCKGFKWTLNFDSGGLIGQIKVV